MNLVKNDEVLSVLEKILKDIKTISKRDKTYISDRFCAELRMLHIYNPEKQADKIKSELSEILEGYEHKKKPQKIYIGTNWKTHDDLLEAYRYAKYPIRKFKVVAKGSVGLVSHYVYADDVSEDENGYYFWIEDKKVGHFTNAVAYYEVRDNESDTN